MKSRFRAINIYLLGISVLVIAAVGCKSQAEKDEELKKKATVRLHLEVNPEVVRRSQMVPIIRSHPIMLNMADDYIIHEGYLEKATMVNTPEGGFAIKLEYNQQGAWTLHNVTSVNVGKHIGVESQFYPYTRWLAAPIIERPITNGVFSFIPDASREETRTIVDGLNFTVAKRKKESFFND